MIMSSVGRGVWGVLGIQQDTMGVRCLQRGAMKRSYVELMLVVELSFLLPPSLPAFTTSIWKDFTHLQNQCQPCSTQASTVFLMR